MNAGNSIVSYLMVDNYPGRFNLYPKQETNIAKQNKSKQKPVFYFLLVKQKMGGLDHFISGGVETCDEDSFYLGCSQWRLGS